MYSFSCTSCDELESFGAYKAVIILLDYQQWQTSSCDNLDPRIHGKGQFFWYPPPTPPTYNKHNSTIIKATPPSKVRLEFRHADETIEEAIWSFDTLMKQSKKQPPGYIFGSARCDCGNQLALAMQQIEEAGRGVLVYLRGHEGRAIGLGYAGVSVKKNVIVTISSNKGLCGGINSTSVKISRTLYGLNAGPDTETKYVILGEKAKAQLIGDSKKDISLIMTELQNWYHYYVLSRFLLASMYVSPALSMPPEQAKIKTHIQIFEIVNLTNKLLPPLPQRTISLPSSSNLFVKGPLIRKSPGKQEETSGGVPEKEKLVTDHLGLLLQFGMDLLPVLIQIYGSSVNAPVRHKCLSVIGKLMYFSTSDMIQSLLSVTNISRYVI
ncbi:hypothetical protein L2E82_06524 [Cichorium intybus]|uniref:Uncharacterized protein n=1 Tax=Cichorium intybus TaxID=13427 RepID=A0ACB9HA99_CICIN|nr:hypothetical protein L2E82_06524 [Cichorium intybus]